MAASRSQGHITCKDFIPIEAPNVNTKTTALIDQVVIMESSDEVFVYLCLKQWRHDAAARRQARQTWAIVDNATEAYLLQKDIENGHISDGFAVSPGSVVALDAKVDTASCSRKLCIVTFADLKQRLLDGSLPHEVTLLLNFGCGYITFDMALGGALAVKHIANKAWNPSHRNGVAMCTVSNDERPFFGRAWPARCLYEVDQPADANLSALLRYRWHKGDMNSVEAFVAKVQEIDQDPDEKASLIFMRCQEFDQSLVDLTRPYHSHHNRPGADAIYVQKHADRARHLVVHPYQMGYYGPTTNLGHVNVYPFTTAWIRSPQTGRPVFCEAVARAQTELRSANRFKDHQGGTPQVHCFIDSQAYSTLSRSPVTSPAHTVHLGKLLLLSIHAYEFDVCVMDMPLCLPEDDFAIEDELRFLRVKGLITQSSPPNSPWVVTGRELANSVLRLTPLGVQTVQVLQYSGIGSLEMAIMLAIIYKGGAPSSEAVLEAALGVASILQPIEGTTNLSEIVVSSKATLEDLADLTHLGLQSFAAAYTRQGPIWLAMALWHRMMNDKNMRNDMEVYTRQIQGTSRVVGLHYEDGVLDVDCLTTYNWDSSFSSFAPLFGLMRDKPLRLAQNLSKEEFLQLEEALVQAHLDRLALLPLAHGRANDVPFAWDLTSATPLLEPCDKQRSQLDAQYCNRAHVLPDGTHADMIVCIYSYLDDGALGNRQGLVPYDLTFVSWEAVSHVMNSAPGDNPWQKNLDKIRSHMALQN